LEVNAPRGRFATDGSLPSMSLAHLSAKRYAGPAGNLRPARVSRLANRREIWPECFPYLLTLGPDDGCYGTDVFFLVSFVLTLFPGHATKSHVPSAGSPLVRRNDIRVTRKTRTSVRAKTTTTTGKTGGEFAGYFSPTLFITLRNRVYSWPRRRPRTRESFSAPRRPARHTRATGSRDL